MQGIGLSYAGNGLSLGLDLGGGLPGRHSPGTLLCTLPHIPPGGTRFRFVPFLVLFTLGTQVSFVWLLYYMVLLFPFIIKKYFVGAILGNYVNPIPCQLVCLSISVQTPVCLFYSMVYNPLVVLLTSKSPTWPLGSRSSWLL